MKAGSERGRVRRGLWSLTAGATLVLFAGAALAKPEGRSLVTYSGLSVHEDRSVSLRVELSKPAPVIQEKSGRTLVFLLSGARVNLRNNLYELPADHFGSTVLSTKLERVRGGVRYTVRLRKEVDAQVEMVNHDGGATLRVEIP